MDCRFCVEENQHSIRTRGYGRSYLPKSGACARHANMTTKQGEWAWSDGHPHERTPRKHEDVEQAAYATSLHHDENTWDILNQSLAGAGFKVSNKREELGDKLAHRDMVQQIGVNPFLGNTNYVDDISIRDQFLKPVNTT